MHIYGDSINQRAIEGSFPVNELVPVNIENLSAVNFEKEAEQGMMVIKENPQFFSMFFYSFMHNVNEMDLLQRPELYEQEVNFLINTGFDPDRFNTLECDYQNVVKLKHTVSPLQKVLWYGAWGYYFGISLDIKPDHYREQRSMMYAWIYLLLLAEEKENKCFRTLNLKQIKLTTNVYKLITSDWNSLDKKWLLKFTDIGMEKLKKQSNMRKDLQTRMQSIDEKNRQVANKTEGDWRIFLNLVNDISRRELSVICKINEAGSAKDKLKEINAYKGILEGVDRGRYQIEGNPEIQLLDLFDRINERYQKAMPYCSVMGAEGNNIVLNPAIFILMMNPKTYNYLFMLFHQFRISPNKNSAKQFASLALSSLRKNLGEDPKTWISIDDMIIDFHSVATRFVQDNKEVIESLSFETLQNDAVIADNALVQTLESEQEHIDLANRLKAFENGPEYDRVIEQIGDGTFSRHSIEDINKQMQSEEERSKKLEEQILARRIVVSLNIIYMFCDAIRIMLTNRHASITFKNRKQIETCRRELMKLDDRLVHVVYSNLNSQEMGMLEYREHAGIITNSLSDQEIQEEEYRNSLFADALKDTIGQMVDNIENQDVDQLLETKVKIRTEIFRLPDCDEKDRYATWLDSISEKLSAELVQNCKKTDEYSTIKQELMESLGEESFILPVSTVDSLTTAEMLYDNYASNEFAAKGFDFSCISALYYQAFEEAYNSLIWRGYADYLNNLTIDGESFCSILEKNRAKLPVNAVGYLDSDGKQRGYYINYKSKSAGRAHTLVSARCMYKSFAILMENVEPNSKLMKFCEYFASTTGYENVVAMFADTEFMKNCKNFTNTVNVSVDNRNNASHGGTIITMEQCKADKKTVLNELEMVRSNSIGLIQQLIYLIKK